MTAACRIWPVSWVSLQVRPGSNMFSVLRWGPRTGLRWVPYFFRFCGFFLLLLFRFVIYNFNGFSDKGKTRYPFLNGQDFREIYLQEWRVVDVATGAARQEGGSYARITGGRILPMLPAASGAHWLTGQFSALISFCIPAYGLRDDTCMINRLQNPNWWGKFDIIGCNRTRAKLNAATMQLLPVQCRPESSYYGGCGGSLFRTRFWANLIIDRSDLHAFGTANKHKFHSDVLLSFLCLLYGGTISDGPPQELVESEHAIRDDTFILHQYKNFYNKQPSENDLYIMNWDGKK